MTPEGDGTSSRSQRLRTTLIEPDGESETREVPAEPVFLEEATLAARAERLSVKPTIVDLYCVLEVNGQARYCGLDERGVVRVVESLDDLDPAVRQKFQGNGSSEEMTVRLPRKYPSKSGKMVPVTGVKVMMLEPGAIYFSGPVGGKGKTDFIHLELGEVDGDTGATQSREVTFALKSFLTSLGSNQGRVRYVETNEPGDRYARSMLLLPGELIGGQPGEVGVAMMMDRVPEMLKDEAAGAVGRMQIKEIVSGTITAISGLDTERQRGIFERTWAAVPLEMRNQLAYEKLMLLAGMAPESEPVLESVRVYKPEIAELVTAPSVLAEEAGASATSDTPEASQDVGEVEYNRKNLGGLSMERRRALFRRVCISLGVAGTELNDLEAKYCEIDKHCQNQVNREIIIASVTAAGLVFAATIVLSSAGGPIAAVSAGSWLAGIEFGLVGSFLVAFESMALREDWLILRLVGKTNKLLAKYKNSMVV